MNAKTFSKNVRPTERAKPASNVKHLPISPNTVLAAIKSGTVMGEDTQANEALFLDQFLDELSPNLRAPLEAQLEKYVHTALKGKAKGEGELLKQILTLTALQHGDPRYTASINHALYSIENYCKQIRQRHDSNYPILR